jgi:uncharacterized membrane protein YhaH (DUF805 family)
MEQLNPLQWAILPLKKYATFSGRAPRPEFWWFILLYAVAQALAAALEYALGMPKLRMGYGAVRLLLGLITLFPLLAVCVRRLHDIGRTGLWVLGVWFLGSVANGVVFGSRMVGATTTMEVFSMVKLAIWALLLAFCALPGIRGPNEYGPDPYGAADLEEVFA